MLRAIIFDFDGVICDTEPLHYRAFVQVLAPLSIPLSEREYYANYVGLNDSALLQTILQNAGRHLSSTEIKRLQRAKDKLYFSTIANGADRLPGVDEFVVRVSRRWPLAICSGTRRVEIETILRRADLLRYFSVIVSADEVAPSKPDPAGYLSALEQLRRTIAGLSPEQCLVIEDSVHGIAAAKAAGMRTLVIDAGDQGRAPLDASRLSMADATVPDLQSIGDDELAAIVG